MLPVPRRVENPAVSLETEAKINQDYGLGVITVQDISLLKMLVL